MSNAILSVQNLNIRYSPRGQQFDIIKNVSFQVPMGKVLGITGASGSGKSMTALAMMGLANFYKDIHVSGQMFFENKEISNATPKEWSAIRGCQMALILQQPESVLNPVKKIGKQLVEAVLLHQNKIQHTEIINKATDLLAKVGLEDTQRILSSFPHELSGGQLQRIVIAMALINDPKIIIADEATSSLDNQTAADVIKLLKDHQRQYQTTLVFISHNMALLKDIADKILLFKDGEVVDDFVIEDMQSGNLSSYAHSYMNASKIKDREDEPISDENISLSVKNLSKTFYNSSWRFWEKKVGNFVLSDVSFDIRAGKMLGVLGPSGSGKTTLAKIITGIISSTDGVIYLGKDQLSKHKLERDRTLRRKVQMVMQDALSSMNPKIKIGEQWQEVLVHVKSTLANKDIHKKLLEILDEYGLPTGILDKYPVQLSGGQRQRAALARTLLMEPTLVVFDESLSALDVFNQHKMVELIIQLQEKHRFTGIFISHDPALIRSICHEVVVLEKGCIIDYGMCGDVLDV